MFCEFKTELPNSQFIVINRFMSNCTVVIPSAYSGVTEFPADYKYMGMPFL